ncbi:MAG: VTT domain-containing protein [Candidatus Methanoperedens sp.]|nr:VTT domain-containing protein [Candidatus Methanoperedens sp.]
MQEKTKGIIQIVFSILIVLVMLYFSDYLEHFSVLGYFGIFIISLFGSATILIPVPSWAFVVGASRILNPYLVGISAGIGSGLGEITGFIAGRGVSHIIHTNKMFIKYKDWITKNDVLAIGILAFIPNPMFDVAGLIAGSLRIKLWRFILPCIIGRIFRYVILAYLGKFSINYI